VTNSGSKLAKGAQECLRYSQVSPRASSLYLIASAIVARSRSQWPSEKLETNLESHYIPISL
jgi:hypothetical protein